MAHSRVGTMVMFIRSVIAKPGFSRLNQETNEHEEVPAVIQMVPTPAHVVGVEAKYNEDGTPALPHLHLAFVHPERVHHLGGSGWRDAYDRGLSVPPATHPDVKPHSEEPQISHYFSEDVEEELYQRDRVKRLVALKQAEGQIPNAADLDSLQAGNAAAGACGTAALPSAEDLDKDAADKEAKAITSGKVRQIKGK